MQKKEAALLVWWKSKIWNITWNIACENKEIKQIESEIDIAQSGIADELSNRKALNLKHKIWNRKSIALIYLAIFCNFFSTYKFNRTPAMGTTKYKLLKKYCQIMYSEFIVAFIRSKNVCIKCVWVKKHVKNAWKKLKSSF